ncbi:MAG: conjugal transfer protein TraF [Aeromonadaceae bacterium]
MTCRFSLSLLTLALGAISSTAMAAPYAFEARQEAMGGTGVASARYLSAPLYNPARLAFSKADDQVGVLLPVVGAEVFDKDDLSGQVDDLSDSYDAYQNAYDAYQANPSADNAAALQAANNKAIGELTDLTGDSGYARAGAGMVVAMPFDALSVAVVVNGYADVQAFADVNANDLTGLLPTDESQVQSRAIAMGAGVSEFGVTLAKSFEADGMRWSVGVTPKAQELQVLNYVASAVDSDFGDITDDQYQSSENGFNLDAGVAASWENGWDAGLAIKNLVKRDLDAPLTNGVQATYELSTVPTAGVSYRWGQLLFNADADLLAQKRFTDLSGTYASFNAGEDDLQMMALGAEWDLWQWAQLRAGYRHDLKDNLDDSLSAGFGISPGDLFHLDLAGTYAGNNQFGGAIQTSLTF